MLGYYIMTEADGITKVYILHPGPSLQQMVPVEVPFNDLNKRVFGRQADAVLDRADFFALNHEEFARRADGSLNFRQKVVSEWEIYQEPRQIWIRVDKKFWKPGENYTKLSQILEMRTRRTDLTIIVSNDRRNASLLKT